MPTEQITEDGQVRGEAERAASGSGEGLSEDDRALREYARKQVERIRSFKLHVIAYVIGMSILTAVWILTEYYEEHTWPDRFSDSDDVAGTWSPWIFYALGIWTFILGVDAYKTYAHRAPSEAEIQKEIDRIKGRKAA